MPTWDLKNILSVVKDGRMSKILFNIQAELGTLHKRETLHEKHPKTESLPNRDGVGSETALEGG